MHFPTDRQPPAGYGECTIFSSIGAQLMQHQRQVKGCLRLKRYRRPGTGNAVVLIPTQQNLVAYQRHDIRTLPGTLSPSSMRRRQRSDTVGETAKTVERRGGQ